MDKYYKGRLERWQDDKGFGFIRSEAIGQSVFVHISAFKRTLIRRPMDGDTIFFQIHSDNNGKQRAVNARIDGMPSGGQSYTTSSGAVTRNKTYDREKKNGGVGMFLIVALVLIGLAVFGYSKWEERSVRFDETQVELPIYSPPPPAFQCQGKIYCSQMTSCQEATFYLRNCPGTQMDGDHDGIPCERQWCN